MIRWPIPPATLLQIGCERLREFAEAYAEVAPLCEDGR